MNRQNFGKKYSKSNKHEKKFKLNFIKIKTICSSKGIIKKIKNQLTVRERI